MFSMTGDVENTRNTVGLKFVICLLALCKNFSYSHTVIWQIISVNQKNCSYYPFLNSL